MFKEIFLELHKIQNYLVKITRNTKFWQTNFEFREIRGTFRETRNQKFRENTKTNISQPLYVGLEHRIKR